MHALHIMMYDHWLERSICDFQLLKTVIDFVAEKKKKLLMPNRISLQVDLMQ